MDTASAFLCLETCWLSGTTCKTLCLLCLTRSRTTRYSSYRLHKVWRVIVQGGKTSRGPCTPWGLEAGFMDKVPGIKFHLVQFCRVGGESWHAVAFCCQRGQIQTQVFALEPLSDDYANRVIQKRTTLFAYLAVPQHFVRHATLPASHSRLPASYKSCTLPRKFARSLALTSPVWR